MRDNPGNLLSAEERKLLQQFGLVIGGKDLMRLLGFKNYNTFQSACAQHRVPVQVFDIAGRRGKYARVKDLARWYLTLGQ